ncbi:hypothetical protein FHG87_001047 [Trinorchestia longiramus]|nr:hypothetical protein FHG87_001047 [Trinorchestia longiramus]
MFGMNVLTWNKGDLEKLEVLQNRVGRLALGAPKWTVVKAIRGDLGWSLFSERMLSVVVIVNFVVAEGSLNITMGSEGEEIPSFQNPQEEVRYWKNLATSYKKKYEESLQELEEYQSHSAELESELEAELEQSQGRCSELRHQVAKLATENESLKRVVAAVWEHSTHCLDPSVFLLSLPLSPPLHSDSVLPSTPTQSSSPLTLNMLNPLTHNLAQVSFIQQLLSTHLTQHST